MIFYISSIGTEPMRIAFEIQSENVVENPQPAEVKVYDYYEPEVKMDKTCMLEDSFWIVSVLSKMADQSSAK